MREFYLVSQAKRGLLCWTDTHLQNKEESCVIICNYLFYSKWINLGLSNFSTYTILQNIVLYVEYLNYGVTVLAFVCVVFISSKWWFRGLIALAFGVWLGMIVSTHMMRLIIYFWLVLSRRWCTNCPVAVGLF